MSLAHILFVIISLSMPVHAQTASNASGITLSLQQVSVEQALKALEKEHGLRFSYFSEQLDQTKRVTIRATNKPLKKVLEEDLGLHPDSYRIEGQYVQIRAQPRQASLRGRVMTAEGNAAPFTTVSVLHGKSVMANAEGYYEIDPIRTGRQTVQVKLVGAELLTREVRVQEGVNTLDVTLSTSAQQLNEVLVVGTKYQVSSKKESESVARMDLPYLQNPQVYSVVDKELIKEQLAITLDEAFRNVPGAAPSKTGAGMPAFFSRGFQTSENFRNGMATYLRTGIDLANVERVEAIKGPSSTFFGAQMTSFGGIINYITKKPHDTFGGEVGFTTGSWNLNRLTADINMPVTANKDVLVRLNAARQQENSFQYQGGSVSMLFAPSISYRVNDRLELSLDADFSSNKGVTPAGWFIANGLQETSFNALNLPYRESLNDNSLVSKQQSSNILLQANYRISDHWQSETKYAWGNGAYDDLYIFDMIWRNRDSVDRILRAFTDENTARHNFQQNVKGDFQIGGVRNRAVIGVDWVSNLRYTRYDGLGYGAKVFESVDLNRLAEAPVIRLEDVQAILAARNTGFNQTNQDTYGAYIADVLTFFDRLHVSLGLRFDRFVNGGTYNTLSRQLTGDYTQHTLSPRLGFALDIVPERISVFGNYLNGFKNIGNQIQPDQSVSVFKAQRANQLEGGTKIAWGAKLHATLTYYHIQVTNSVMNRIVDNMNFYFQEGEQKSEGFEAELMSNPLPGFNVLTSYGYNHNRFLKANASVEGKRALGTPEHVLNAWATYALLHGPLKGLGFGTGFTYVSDSFLDASNKFVLDGYQLLDATVYYNHPKFRLSVKGNNLLDKRYWVSDGYYARPQRPANFLASVAYRF